MKISLKELKNIHSDNCITIILTTHRSKPDYLNDSLRLKNLIKEVERRLNADLEKKQAEKLINKVQMLADSIDHSHNLESLILFVNEEIAEYSRLPIKVEDRVVIDETFHTRDLVRAMHFDASYYVLVLNKQKTRLIEASSDKVVREVGDPFPIENTQFYTTSPGEASMANRDTNLTLEFFNRIDKEVNNIRHQHSLPVLICSTENNYHEYLKIADKKHSILEKFMPQTDGDAKANIIVDDAWKIVKELTVENNNA